MRKIRDVLTYIFERRLSNRQVARITGINRTTVSEYQKRFNHSGLPWPLPSDMDDIALENQLFPNSGNKPSRSAPVSIDLEYIHLELQKRGATLAALHAEWLEQAPAEQHISYSQFCRRYLAYKQSLKISLRRTEVYGETAYVDYSGTTIDITNPQTGEIKIAQVFIGVLGGSNYTYCEATWTQRSRDWIGSHVRMLEYFGGVPRIIVPDNLKAAVIKAHRLFPVINETYRNMCRHYGAIPFPARSGRPKDKARAEGGVLLVQRWILFRLRRHKFFSLEEANREIRKLLDQLNHKPFQKLSGSRYTRWIEHEMPTLQPLPAQPYEFAEWGKVRAGIDYHVYIDGHNYSVPYQHRGHELDYRMTDTGLELIFKGKPIAIHRRSYETEGTSTLDGHQHPSHKAVEKWNSEDGLSWAAGIGPSTETIMRAQLSKVVGHYLGYRMTQSMKSLAKAHGATRLEEACTYALAHRITKIPDLRNVLDKCLDKLFAQDMPDTSSTDIEHENIRGAHYYEQILTKVKDF
jgi:transposase